MLSYLAGPICSGYSFSLRGKDHYVLSLLDDTLEARNLEYQNLTLLDCNILLLQKMPLPVIKTLVPFKSNLLDNNECSVEFLLLC